MDYTALGNKDRTVMGDSECDLRSLGKRSRRLNKAPEQAQILCVCGDVSFCVQDCYFDTRDEWETLSAMVLDGDGKLPSPDRILFQAAVRSNGNRHS
jgi:hypothetical protein